jgi:hypothetical protein
MCEALPVFRLVRGKTLKLNSFRSVDVLSRYIVLVQICSLNT